MRYEKTGEKAETIFMPISSIISDNGVYHTFLLRYTGKSATKVQHKNCHKVKSIQYSSKKPTVFRVLFTQAAETPQS